MRQDQVFAHRQFEDCAFVLAVFRAEADAGGDGVAWGGEITLLAVDRDRTGIRLVRAEQQARRLGAPGAQQAGEAQHFALADFQIHRLQGALAAQADCTQKSAEARAAADRGLRRIRVGDRGCLRNGRRTHHLVDQLNARQIGGQVFPFPLAIAHHCNPIRNCIGLIKEVRHKQNRHALLAQTTQNVEQ
jgi:hypothetical protein